MHKSQLLNQFKIKEKLKFDTEKSTITLDANRMVLLHAEAFSHLKHELFQTLDPKIAQGIMLRMGFKSGQLDADVAFELYGSADNYDVFELGPAIHGLEGFVQTEITDHEIDWEKGSFYGRVRCSNSVEAERYIQEHDHNSDYPICWSIVGYASGFVSRFFKRFIVFKEIECKACGDEVCILIGKPVEAWGDDTYINYFKPDYEQESPLESELNKLRGIRPFKQFDQGDLLGESKEFTKAFEYLTHAANTPINVLLQGETGVGKEVFASWLHKNSERSSQPFVAINCGAIPNDLIEAELFGVKRGAYTGASESRPGRFELANKGTLFLDELGELSPSAQVKLLRVLQTGELQRLGDTKTIKVDVRLVAATNVNLKEAIEQGEFRSDLYYRIATYPIEIPPLRDRKSDIPILVNSMMEKYAPLYKKSINGITDAAMSSLMAYEWPGNIRELQNIIERAVLLAPDNGMIEQFHLEHNRDQALHQPVNMVAEVQQQLPSPSPQPDDVYKHLLDSNLSLQEYELNLINKAMESTNGNMTRAAELLGITRRQIAYKLKGADS